MVIGIVMTYTVMEIFETSEIKTYNSDVYIVRDKDNKIISLSALIP